MANDRILIDHHIMGGVPCVRGTRIPVATILGLMAAGVSTSEVLDTTLNSCWMTSLLLCICSSRRG